MSRHSEEYQLHMICFCNILFNRLHMNAHLESASTRIHRSLRQNGSESLNLHDDDDDDDDDDCDDDDGLFKVFRH